MKPVRMLAMAAVAAIAALPVGGAFSATRANDWGGTYVRCAELTDFTPPSEVDDGSILMRGIGPGWPRNPDDLDHHPFPFAPDIALDPALVTKLSDLAAGDHYTCLRMTTVPNETAMWSEVSSIAIEPSTRLCGPISQLYDGTYHFVVVTEWWGDLVGDADALIKSDPHLNSLLHTLSQYQDESTCLTLATDAAGRLRSVAVDANVAHCGLVTYRDDLVVGDLLIADADSPSSDLLPEKARAAATTLIDTGTTACLDALVVDSHWQSALLSFSMRRCGDVTRSASGAIEIDELAIPGILLSERQTTKLEAAVEGQGCITVEVVSNVTTVALSDLYGPPPTDPPDPTDSSLPSVEPTPTAAASAPVPSRALPSATPAPGPSLRPTSSPLPVAPTATLTDGDPLVPIAIVAMVVLVAASTGSYVMYRRQRREAATAEGPDQSPIDDPVTGGSSETAAVALSAEPGSALAQVALTPREQEVLGMLLDGLSNKEIAGRLFISESTAGVHVSNLMAKLGAHSRGEAAAIAYRSGLGVSSRLQH